MMTMRVPVAIGMMFMIGPLGLLSTMMPMMTIPETRPGIM